MRSPLETKVKRGVAAGGSTAIAAGLIASFLPASVPVSVKALVPAILATLVHFITAYEAPHTDRDSGWPQNRVTLGGSQSPAAPIVPDPRGVPDPITGCYPVTAKPPPDDTLRAHP
jgi:hypothetical protein